MLASILRGMTSTITLSDSERQYLTNHVVFVAAQCGEGLDRPSLDRVAIVREMHAEPGRFVALLNDIEREAVPVTPALRALAEAVRQDALDSLDDADNGTDALIYRGRLDTADTLLKRMRRAAGG
jgi:hypothetical protein